MNILQKVKISRKTAMIGVAGALAIAVPAVALQPSQQTKADEEPPIVQQVNDHENRIGSLEDRADETETKVNQNTADIQTIQNETGVAPAPAVEPVQTPRSINNGTPATPKPSAPAPAPSPAPEPVDPWTIVRIDKVPGGSPGSLKCTYHLQNGKYKNINHGDGNCYEVGTIIPYIYRPK